MPTITLNKKVLLDNIGKEFSDEELANRITYLGTDLDSIDDEEIVVEVFPNRPDLLSEQGFSRALSAFVGKKKGLRSYKVRKSREKVIIDDSVRNVRPYTACAIVKGLKLDHDKIVELVNIQEKLHVTFGRNRRKVAIGMYPMEKIEMPIHYKALLPSEIRFRPLESEHEMTAKEILEEHPKGISYGHLLDGLDAYPVFMDDKGKILSMPPVINSHEVGKVTEETEELFIECSGHDFRALNLALNMLVTTFADMGAKIYSMKLKYAKKSVVTPNLDEKEMKFDPSYVARRLGLKISERDLRDMFARMGFDYKKGKVKIPAYRADILHPIDLAEDIAIAYGYDNFSEEIPNVSTIGGESGSAVIVDKIREVLLGHGLIEVTNYSLSNEKVQNKKMLSELDLVILANSLSEEYDVLRAWLIPCLIKTLSENKNEVYPQELFEIGNIFKKAKTDTGVAEPVRAAVALCNEKADYTKAKQVLDSVFEAIGIDALYEETEHPSFIPGRVARVLVNGKGIAYIGEVHPEVLENFKLEMPVAAFELNITDIEVSNA